MKLSAIKDPRLVQRLLKAMHETDQLVARLKKEIPHEIETHREVPSPQPEPAVRHEPLATHEGKAQGAKRTVVRITSYRNRLCDVDNLCVKALVDGLRYCGLIPDDRPEDIELHVAQFKCPKPDERTEIELIYPD